MKLFNDIILIIIAIVALLSLVVEMEDRRDFKHELSLKICFGSLAVGSFSAVIYDDIIWYSFMNTCFLIVLLIRLLQRKKI